MLKSMLNRLTKYTTQLSSCMLICAKTMSRSWRRLRNRRRWKSKYGYPFRDIGRWERFMRWLGFELCTYCWCYFRPNEIKSRWLMWDRCFACEMKNIFKARELMGWCYDKRRKEK